MSVVEQLEAAGEVLSPVVRAAIVALEEIAAQVPRLEARIRELEARLGLDSTNSSLPPSADPPGVRRRGKLSTGRMRGAQKGHPGAHRSLLPPERVDELIEHRPCCCRHCGHSLVCAAEVGTRGRHQQIELPPIRAYAVEHQLLTLACPGCRHHTVRRCRPRSGPGALGRGSPPWRRCGLYVRGGVGVRMDIDVGGEVGAFNSFDAFTGRGYQLCGGGLGGEACLGHTNAGTVVSGGYGLGPSELAGVSVTTEATYTFGIPARDALRAIRAGSFLGIPRF